MRSILFLLVMIWCVLLAAWCFDVADSEPAPHQRYATMLRGGTPRVTDYRMAILGSVFASLLVLVFHVCLRIGSGAAWDASRSLRVIGRTSTALLVVTFTILIWVSHFDATRQDLVMWGPFPRATSLLFLSGGVVPLLFGGIYVVGYTRWFGQEFEVGQVD